MSILKCHIGVNKQVHLFYGSKVFFSLEKSDNLNKVRPVFLNVNTNPFLVMGLCNPPLTLDSSPTAV